MNKEYQTLLKALTICSRTPLSDAECLCDVCPYNAKRNEDYTCGATRDALEMLRKVAVRKALDPKLYDAQGLVLWHSGDMMWFEDRIEKELFPVILVTSAHVSREAGFRYYFTSAARNEFDRMECSYGRTWRCWEARPSEEIRMEAEWDGEISED